MRYWTPETTCADWSGSLKLNMGNPGRKLPGFFVCDNDQSTFSETFKVVITIGGFDNSFELVIKTFSYGVSIMNLILAAWYPIRDTDFPFKISGTNFFKFVYIGIHKSFGDIFNKTHGFSEVSSEIILIQILKDVPGYLAA